ncbi:hypothetical protein K492DRAFT_194640 [Lichtheimia hyalospora FSU 10163]|nr:hypothetical protein K492DRAFT_194640 [Lichtheimia hyalospora FSU 10163]
MSSFGGLFGITSDSYDLMIKSSQAMRATPYGLVCLAAFCYLLQAAINCSLSSQTGTSTDMVSRSLAAYFFGPLFPILAWVLVLDTFRSAYTKMEETTTWVVLKSDLVGTFAGYLWAFIMVICDIAFVGSIGSGNLSQSTLSNALHIREFVTYGLWGFVPLYIYQQYSRWNVTRAFFRSFAIFATLVILVTIGRTINTAVSMNNLDGSQAMAAEATDFVLARILGVIGLYWVIAFGHTWVNNGDSITQDNVNRFHVNYLSTLVQVCLLSLLCLCCPGMSSALSSLGAVALMYVFFALVGIFAGAVTNKLGVRWTLMV